MSDYPKKKKQAPKRRHTIRIVLLLSAIMVGVGVFVVINPTVPEVADVPDTRTDMLWYITGSHMGLNEIMLYDPRTRIATEITSDVSYFAVSPDGRIAYSDIQNPNLYIYDLTNPDIEPLAIVFNIFTIPISWSPDGKNLLFSIGTSNDTNLYVWDGVTITKIIQDNEQLSTSAGNYSWSHDGRLAFHHSVSINDVPYTKVYIWNQDELLELSHLMPHSIARMSWSEDNNLAFMINSTTARWNESEGKGRDFRDMIYVWDGETMINGQPDVFSFSKLPIDAPVQTHLPIRWIKNNIIQFETYNSESTELYRANWNIDTNEITFNNTIQRDGWFGNLSNEEQYIFYTTQPDNLGMMNNFRMETLDGELIHTTQVNGYAWSEDKYLTYCTISDNSGWYLSVWDGQETWHIDSGVYIFSWLNSGTSDVCYWSA